MISERRKLRPFLKLLSDFMGSCSEEGLRFIDDFIPFLTPYLSASFSNYSESFISQFSIRPYLLSQLKAKLLLLLNDQVEAVDSIQLMTAHHSKGKEFAAVFVLGLEEGNFPYTFGTTIDLEEERRVLYVAMTRAKEFLYLGFVRNRYYFGSLCCYHRLLQVLIQLYLTCIFLKKRFIWRIVISSH